MVCVDGFILTHAYERVDIPTQEQVDAYLPPYQPRQALDPDEPVSIGAMVGPEAFFEVRYLQHARQLQALALIPGFAAEFKARFGRDSGGLIRTYRTDDAETIIVALGSINGTIKHVIDEMRQDGNKIGCLTICSFRPFPLEEVREALSGMSLKGYTVIAGLGGRAIGRRSLRELFEKAQRDELEQLNFLDLNWEIVNREIARARQQRRSGPIAENILRELGTVAAKTG